MLAGAAAALRLSFDARRQAAGAGQRRLGHRRDGRRRRLPLGRPAPRIDLTEDPAILTAIANDIGTEAIFSRQVIAYGAAGDALLALSTSGNSGNVIAALAEARRRGLVTIAMVGYDGGRVAAEGLADHVVVTRSEHIPRIQEAQASAYHALRALVDERTGAGRERGARRADGRAGARPRARARSRAWGSAPTSTGWRASSGWAGSCSTTRMGSSLEVEGADAAVDAFLARLAPEAPPLAAVEEVACEPRPPTGEAASRSARARTARCPTLRSRPTRAVCADCLRELFDPADRRFRYPFINCTNCGPRFTIVRGVPYDRPLTTMAGFAMCPDCRAEYEDPDDRRFHAQPNACPVCGPRATLSSTRWPADRR